MPFTVSHAAIVLPLLSGRPAAHLVGSALIIGTMIPDLPYFVPLLRGSDQSHAATGPVTTDLIMGLVVFALWEMIMKGPLTALSPRALQRRLPTAPEGEQPLRRWLWAVPSLVIGATTHVCWDMFTHKGRWGTRTFPALTEQLGPLPIFKWLQFGSGVIGLLVIAAALLWWWTRAPLVGTVAAAALRHKVIAWVIVLGSGLSVFAAVWLIGINAGRPVLQESLLFQMATHSMGAVAAALVVVCCSWHVNRIFKRREALAVGNP